MPLGDHICRDPKGKTLDVEGGIASLSGSRTGGEPWVTATELGLPIRICTIG